MLEWKVNNEDKKLKTIIKNTKDGFDSWFNSYWSHKCSKETMLSKESPLEHVYYKMCKPIKEIKKKYPLEGKEQCSSCGKYVDEWIETSFSFCDEYGCGMSLCKECAKKLYEKMDKWLNK
jgi:hypothetical protein